MVRKFNPVHAHKLDSEERRLFQPIEAVLDRICVEHGMRIADLGAGTGYFAIPLAQAVGSSGKVYAVDVSKELLTLLQEKIAAFGISNIELVALEAEDTGLPGSSMDMIFMANVWHEFENHPRLLKECCRLLVPHGRVVIVDWRPGVARPPGPPEEERISMERVCSDLVGSGFQVLAAENLGQYHYLVSACRTKKKE